MPIPIAIDSAFTGAGVEPVLACVRAERRRSADTDRLDAKMAAIVTARTAELGSAADDPVIKATRQAYKRLGKDPSRYRPASEALLRRVLQGKGLFRVNPLVDVNNLVSLATGVPSGLYDLDQVRPPITFRPGRTGESYDGIGRGPINLENLPLLADEEGPFGSATSDGERTKVGANTDRVLMVLMGLCVPRGELERAAALAATCFEDLGGAEVVERWFVDEAS